MPTARRRMLMDLALAGAMLAATGLLAGPLASLSGCAALGPPRRITLDESEIQRRIAREFPLERRLLDLFDVTLMAPVIELLPEANRIAASVDLRARERLLGGLWVGHLHFDAELRWDAADRSLRLVQVRVQDLAWRDPGGSQRSSAERLSAAIAERVLDGARLYRMPADVAARLDREGVMPGSVAVTARGVEITLVPTTGSAPAAAS